MQNSVCIFVKLWKRLKLTIFLSFPVVVFHTYPVRCSLGKLPQPYLFSTNCVAPHQVDCHRTIISKELKVWFLKTHQRLGVPKT